MITFKRWLHADLQTIWDMVWIKVQEFQLSDIPGKIGWRLSKKGTFSMKFVYEALTKAESGRHFKHIWKGKIPAKMKFFMWLLENDALLTKDNMIKRNWKGSPECYFCNHNESINHLFFSCSVARVVLGLCGKMCGGK